MAGVPSTSQLLDGYLQHRPDAPSWRVSIDGSVDSRLVSPTRPAPSIGHQRQAVTVFRDQDRYDVRMTQTGVDATGTVIDPGQELVRRVIGRDDSGRGFSWETTGGGPPKRGTFSPDPAKANWFANNRLQMWGGEAFDGIVGRDTENFAAILKRDPNSRMRAEPEAVDGHPCYVVESQTPEYGKYEIWIDPQAAYLPRRVVVEKSGGNQYAGQTVAGTSWVSTKWTLDGVKVEQRDGATVPVEFTVGESYRAADGTVSESTSRFKVGEFQLNPDLKAAGAFQVDVPSGTTFSMWRMPQISYQWNGHELVPIVDQAVVSAIESSVDRAVPAAASGAASSTGASATGDAPVTGHATVAASGNAGIRPLWVGSGVVIALIVVAAISMGFRRGRRNRAV